MIEHHHQAGSFDDVGKIGILKVYLNKGAMQMTNTADEQDVEVPSNYQNLPSGIMYSGGHGIMTLSTEWISARIAGADKVRP